MTILNSHIHHEYTNQHFGGIEQQYYAHIVSIIRGEQTCKLELDTPFGRVISTIQTQFVDDLNLQDGSVIKANVR